MHEKVTTSWVVSVLLTVAGAAMAQTPTTRSGQAYPERPVRTIAPAFAHEYPTKPIRIIVGSSAGGGGDTMARLMARTMTPALGQQVIIDNRAGAGGNVGADIVAKAAPDGTPCSSCLPGM